MTQEEIDDLIIHVAGVGETMSDDALDHATSIEDVSELTTYFLCPGCDFPHLSEQQAVNCCPPQYVFCCPVCEGFRPSEQAARECCS